MSFNMNFILYNNHYLGYFFLLILPIFGTQIPKIIMKLFYKNYYEIILQKL